MKYFLISLLLLSACKKEAPAIVDAVTTDIKTASGRCYSCEVKISGNYWWHVQVCGGYPSFSNAKGQPLFAICKDKPED